jgi:hypothetical protein
MGTETAIHGNHISVKTQDGKTVVVMLCAGNYCCFKAQARFIKPASVHGSERPIILSSAHLLKYFPPLHRCRCIVTAPEVPQKGTIMESKAVISECVQPR